MNLDKHFWFFKVIFQCHLIYFRSRIGTETSIETSVENPTCIDRGVGNESFEEELLKVLNSRDDDEYDEVLLSNSDMKNRQNSLNSSNLRDELTFCQDTKLIFEW